MNLFAPLNYLIKLLYENGLSQTVYWLWHFVDITVLFIFGFNYCKKYGIKRSQFPIIYLIEYVLGLGLILFIGWAESGFTVFGANNIVKCFSFLSIFGLIPSAIFKIKWRKLMDFSAPAFALQQFCGHLPCNFTGCCHGYPWENGVWNCGLNEYLFPNQLLESLVSLLICISCVLLAKKNSYKVTGKIYPFFLITFGITRFFLELLRDNTKIIWGISDLAIWALIMFVTGIVMMICINVYDGKLNNPK